jgi:hypothetical protein
MATEMQDDALLAARFEDAFTRLLIAKSVRHSAVLAALMGAAVSYDGPARAEEVRDLARQRGDVMYEGRAADLLDRLAVLRPAPS